MKQITRFRSALARLAALTLLFTTTASAGGSDPIVTTDVLRLRTVGAIDVSPDGRRAVVSVRSIGPAAPGAPAAGPLEVEVANGAGEPRWRNHAHLYLFDLADPGAPARRLTWGDRSDTNPVLSPDGEHIAFTRRADRPGPDGGAAPAQVWVMPANGGEARVVTALPDGAGSPRWSPDGRRLLVTSVVPARELPGPPDFPSERAGGAAPPAPDGTTPRPDGTRAEIRAWLDANGQASDPVVIDRLSFQDETDLRGPIAFRQLYLVDPDAEPGATDTAPIALTAAHRDHRDAVFTPDGRSVLYTSTRRRGVHPDRELETSIGRCGLDGGADVELLARDGWSFRRPRPSSDGLVIAFLGEQSDQPAHRPWRLGIVSVVGDGTTDPVWLTEEATFDASVDAFTWLPAQSALVFSAARGGGFPLMTMGLGLLEPAPLVDEVDGLPAGVHAFAAGGGAVVYALTEVGNPCTLRVRDARGDRLLLDLNEWVEQKNLVRPERRRVARPDGLEVEYWVMPPTDRVPGRTYPVVVEVHGGPSAMWGPGELTMWHEFQLLCSWGYGVMYANPRGSGGYGYAFQRANFQDWGAGPGGDVLAMADAAVLEDWIDQGRLVLTGGSYGGYLTAWIVGHDHRFKAAVAQRGVYDLATFYGEGNAWRLLGWSMGGPPWDARARAVIQRESPFTSVNRIRTPLLIMHGSADLRTGVSQSEMLYRALKDLGRPVEYVRYPNAGHDLSRTGDPHQRLDRLARIIEFFERHVDNPRVAPGS